MDVVALGATYEPPLKVLLDKAGTEVDVDLYERGRADSLEAVDLTGLDDKNVSGFALKGLAVDRPDSLSFADELDFVIGMAMGPRPRTGLAMKQEHRNAGAALLRSDELMRTADERKVLLANVMHAV